MIGKKGLTNGRFNIFKIYNKNTAAYIDDIVFDICTILECNSTEITINDLEYLFESGYFANDLCWFLCRPQYDVYISVVIHIYKYHCKMLKIIKDNNELLLMIRDNFAEFFDYLNYQEYILTRTITLS